MRSMFRSVLVALVAVFAIGAIAAGSASAALPEFETDANPPINYTSATGEVTLQTTESHKSGDLAIHCKASVDKGETAGVHGFKSFIKIHITYTGCKVVTSETACTSKGAATGEVVTNLLTATLVYINKATKEVGLVFKPEVVGGTLAEYTCGTTIGKVKLSGAVIAKLPNEQVNKLESSFSWDYRQKAGIQESAEYEEGATKVSAFLTSSYLLFMEHTGEETTETMTFGSPVEVIA